MASVNVGWRELACGAEVDVDRGGDLAYIIYRTK